MAQTFTVPTTDDYTSSQTGHIHRFHQGDVVSTALAVEFGMAGAALDVPGTSFTAEQVAYLDARLAALTLDDLSGVTLGQPRTGDAFSFDGSVWRPIPPSGNPSLENNDLTRWGKDNDTDWTTFERISATGASGQLARSGEWHLHVVQSAPRRTYSNINTQAGGTVNGQAVLYGIGSATGYNGLPVGNGDAVAVSVWVCAATAPSAGNRVWLMSWQNGAVGSPITLTQVYQQVSISFNADGTGEDNGEGVYIFFEGDETDAYRIDDASFVATPA